MGSENSLIILFDGQCNLCSRLVQFTIKRDLSRKFKFAALQSAVGKDLLNEFGLSANDFDSFVFVKGNRYFIRSTASLMLLKELGGIWKLFYIFMVVPRSLRDFIYYVVAKLRYKIFGRKDACIIPAEHFQARLERK